MKAHSKRVNGNNPDEEIYQPTLKRRAEIKTRDQLKETQPLTQAERARTEIKDIPDSEERKKAVHFLIDMLLHEEEFRDVVLEAVDPYFRIHADEEFEGIAPEMIKEEFRDVVLEAVDPYFRIHADEEEFEGLTPEVVKEGFEQLARSYENSKPGSGGRRPERSDRLYAVIKGRENEAIPLEDFAAMMPPTVKNPRVQVSRDIFKTNADFQKFNIPFLIEGLSKGYGDHRRTFYRISYRSE